MGMIDLMIIIEPTFGRSRVPNRPFRWLELPSKVRSTSFWEPPFRSHKSSLIEPFGYRGTRRRTLIFERVWGECRWCGTRSRRQRIWPRWQGERWRSLHKTRFSHQASRCGSKIKIRLYLLAGVQGEDDVSVFLVQLDVVVLGKASVVNLSSSVHF